MPDMSARRRGVAAVAVLLGTGAAGAAAGAVRARRVAPANTVELRAAFPEADDLLRALERASLRVAVAESCTGGLFAAALTANPGASRVIVGGVIAYSDEVKQSILGVPEALLARHGAVSREVATAMAEGARRVCAADIGVGITGIAGPGTDGTTKPAGLVFVAVSGPGHRTSCVEIREDLGREPNRAVAVATALRLLRQALP